MNRFVKVKGYPNWFLAISKIEDIPNNLERDSAKKILEHEFHQHVKRKDDLFAGRVHFAANHMPDYAGHLKKYGPIVVREIGSFMTLKESEVIDEKFSEGFPIDEYGEIVICENDGEPEQYWLEYLEKRFPGKKIVTINHFKYRHESEVAEYFAKAKHVTFSTTFSDFDWFKKLTKNLTSDNEVIGYCHDKNRWVEAKEIYPNVEVVEF